MPPENIRDFLNESRGNGLFGLLISALAIHMRKNRKNNDVVLALKGVELSFVM
jgi:hypothetical protein